MKSYRPYKDLTDKPTPPNSYAPSIPRFQSGPFSLLPGNDNYLYLGRQSVIRFGDIFNYDLSSYGFEIQFGLTIVKIPFTDGIPGDFEIIQGVSSYKEIEYKDNTFPSPTNVISISFPIAEISAFNSNLVALYGDSVAFNTNQTYSAIRRCYTSVQIVQVCYGFIMLPSPYV